MKYLKFCLVAAAFVLMGFVLNYLTSMGKKAVQNELIAKVTPGSLSSFGEDSNNNLYILNYGDGKIYKLVATQ